MTILLQVHRQKDSSTAVVTGQVHQFKLSDKTYGSFERLQQNKKDKLLADGILVEPADIPVEPPTTRGKTHTLMYDFEQQRLFWQEHERPLNQEELLAELIERMSELVTVQQALVDLLSKQVVKDK